ncbi:MAG: hypothetical protein AABY91_06865 [Gemmatimonadota bacterium]
MTIPTSGGLPQHGAGPETIHALPLGYFAVALLWLAIGSVGLIAVTPDLVAGNGFSPRVFAVTHAFTLGFLVSAVFGALHQFIPAVMGVPIRRWGIALAGFWLLQAGALLLTTALWTYRPAWQAVGWVTVFGGVALGSLNTIPARRRAVRNREVGVFISLGHSALGAAMLVALARIGSGLGWWTVGREALLAVHFHLGVLGFGTLTIVGIGSRMLPAFFQAPPAHDKMLRAIGWFVTIGMLVYSTGLLAGWLLVMQAGGGLMVAAVTAHLVVLVSYIRHRKVRRPDPALGLLIAAVVMYAVAFGLGMQLLATGAGFGRTWIVYAVLAIAGWLTLVVLGVMHRIIPRLIIPLVIGRGRRPPGEALTGTLASVGLGWATVGCLSLGVILLGAGILRTMLWLAQAGAIGFALGVLLVGTQWVLLLRRAAGGTP